MIKNLPIRYQELGRIRGGDKETVTNKAGKAVERPRKAEHWILSCDEEHVLEVAGGVYGGAPEGWDGGEQKYRLYTETDRLDVLVPADALFSALERWGSGGCQRRCDGVNAMIAKQNDQGGELVEEPCWCAARNLTAGDADDIKKGACDLVVRLKVVLPDLPGLGVWILTTGSIYAAMELPGAVALLDRLRQGGTLVEAELVLQERTEKKAWERYERRYRVPTLNIRQSFRELSAGAQVQQLGEGNVAALPPHRESSRPSTIGDKPGHVQQVVYACSQHGVSKADAEVLCSHFSGRRTTSRKDLNLGEAGAMIAVIVDGSWEAIVKSERDAVTADGTAGEPAEPATAEPAQPTLEEAAAKADVGMPDALRKAWNAFAMLPVELKQEGQKYLLDHDFPDDWRLLTPEHITELVELVDSLCMEAESPAAPGTAPAEGETWDAEQWTTAAKAAGVTKAALLKEARRFAAEIGVEQPKSIEEITGESLASRVRSWLGERKAS